MKKIIQLPFFLTVLTVLLCSCEDDYHYNVKIINNSDKTVVLTGSRAGSTIIGSLEADVTFSWVFQNGLSPVSPHSESILDMSPIYFEMFTHTDRNRFYFIDKEVFDAAGGKPKNLKPDDYLGYIDLFASEAEAMEWTIRFPDDTINNMKEKE